MAKRRANGQMSNRELDQRRFNKQVKRVKKFCEDQDITLHTWDEADGDELCVISTDEYYVGSRRDYLKEDASCYFVAEEFYEDVSREAMYLK